MYVYVHIYSIYVLFLLLVWFINILFSIYLFSHRVLEYLLTYTVLH